MTTTLDSKFTIPPIISPDSLIVKAARGVNEDWTRAKEEFNARLEKILSTWSCPDSSAYTTQIASFPAPPHTVQRLAELLQDPTTWYSSLPKFVRALVRVLSVTSTTIDYTEEEKKSSHVVLEDSLLVPIPWLSPSSPHQDHHDLSPVTTTTMPNGVRFTVQSGRIDGHDLLSDANVTGGARLGSTGTAPIDAADYGPQSEDVKEAIAMNGNAARTSETPAAAVVENGNGRIDEMDTTV